MRNTAPKDAAELEGLETREWLESLDYVLQSGGPARVGRLLGAAPRSRPAQRRQAPLHRQYPLHQHHLRRGTAAVSRQPGDRAAHQEPRAVERAGDGGQGQQARRWDWRSYLDVRVGGDAVRSRPEPLLQGEGRRPRRRHHLFPGACGARHLRPRVSRRSLSASSTSRTSAASCCRAAGSRRIRTRG